MKHLMCLAILLTVLVSGCSHYGEYERIRLYGIVDAVYASAYYEETDRVNSYLEQKVESGQITIQTSDAIKACMMYINTVNSKQIKYRGYKNGEREIK